MEQTWNRHGTDMEQDYYNYNSHNKPNIPNTNPALKPPTSPIFSLLRCNWDRRLCEDLRTMVPTGTSEIPTMILPSLPNLNCLDSIGIYLIVTDGTDSDSESINQSLCFQNVYIIFCTEVHGMFVYQHFPLTSSLPLHTTSTLESACPAMLASLLLRWTSVPLASATARERLFSNWLKMLKIWLFCCSVVP